MSRKVFVSFLGTSIYKPTFYKAANQQEKEVKATRFIQEALVETFCKDFNKIDEILIFTTDEAIHNWSDSIHWDPNANEKILYDSLQKRLNHLGLTAKVKNIMIPNGKSTEEIWTIFQLVFQELEKQDELVFDITHGFRSLPLLNMVLINYAKLLKDITVRGIYYGNWEAKYSADNKSFSPIWDLKDFEDLQEWTNAAQLFLKAGSADSLSTIMANKKINGSKEIQDFSREILANRGIDLTEGKSALAIKNLLLKAKNDFIHPVIKPIFELIETQFSNYEEGNILNGMYAVKWCIDHDLIQQGYTLMSEFLPTYVLNYIGEDYQNKDARDTINGILSIEGKRDMFKFNNQIETWQNEILDKTLEIPYFKKLCERIKSINPQNRNDINHAGFRNTPKDYSTLKKELSDKYEKLKKIILKIENEK